MFFATHKLTGRQVAIKEMNKTKYEILRITNRVSEGHAMTLCQGSPNVIKFIEEFSMQDKVYIITKFYQGGDLISYMDNEGMTKLSEDGARKIVVQIAQGLSDIHKAGICHRDIKHLNIFISNSGASPVVKIGDFGHSARLNTNEAIKKLAGTIGFMAPEVVLDEPSDFKSDVWSLGIILYALISTGVPFIGNSREEFKTSITQSPLTFNRPVWRSIS